MDNENYDVIIVGAGLGGLVSGAALSKEGLRVLVLEKADNVGGRLRFTRHGDFMIPIGMHGFLRENVDKAMARCDVKATLYECGHTAFYNLKKHKVYNVAGSPEEILATYMEGLGWTQEDVAAIQKAWESTLDPETFRGKDFSQWVEGLGLSSRVKSIMDQLWRWHTDHGIDVAEKVSMDTYATGLVPFFISEKPCYTCDQSLPDAFAYAITQNNGEVKLRTEVKTLSIDKGHVTGIMARDSVDDSWEVYRAPKVIINVPIFQALQWGLIKEKDFPSEWVRVSREISPYMGGLAFNWYGLRERVFEHTGYVYILDEEPVTKTYTLDVGSTAALSNHMPTLCPPNKQLVYATSHMTVDEVKDADTWPKKIAHGHHLMQSYFKDMGYPPLEDIMEFRYTTYQVPSWDLHVFSTYWKDLPDFRAPNIKGLYFTGSTVKPVVGSFGVDNVAGLGIGCADAVLEDE